MKRHFPTQASLFFFLLFLAVGCTPRITDAYRATAEEYHYQLSLKDITNDQLLVELAVPRLKREEVLFRFPRIVPGIYGFKDFGKHIEQLEARDAAGNILPVERIDTNSWRIQRAAELAKITYRANDGWEAFSFGPEEEPVYYRSAESSFSEREVAVINNNTVFGYFEGLEQLPVRVSYKKPADFYGATSLPLVSESPEAVSYRANDYRHLVDNPVLFSKPDTAHIELDGVQVTVAVYSSAGTPLAESIARHIEPLLANQKAYLGGQLPVERYTFMLYHNEATGESFMAGGDGLEHSNSTLILLYIPLDEGFIKDNVYHLASHEFFHTILPLGIHSEEIEYYDFQSPEMSRHLWLYEGMTEYFTIHMPVKQGIQSLEAFLAEVSRKASAMQEFDNSLSLVALSQNVLDKSDQYYNVYLRGALTCLCLDIRLRELSNGAYGVQHLIRDLLKEYGPGRPFRDEALFEKIRALTYEEEIGRFIEQYLIGSEPLPLQEYLLKTGLDYDPEDHSIEPLAGPTPVQLQLREWWLDGE